MNTRIEQFLKIFPHEPKFRMDQVSKALFTAGKESWNDITTLPKEISMTLEETIPWMAVQSKVVKKNKTNDTFKAVLHGHDDQLFETVLMSNNRNQWTICVSSQVGCAMKCQFCATGTMGLKRSLTSDEIIDQYRFWVSFLAKQFDSEQRISNVVFMGMGEPLANYDSLKTALNTLLKYTDIGETKITVSSVGILSQLDKLNEDSGWPPVRLAISLHSANQVTRKTIVPTTLPDFLTKLQDWAKKYNNLHGNRNHHVTFEYIMLKDINDTPEAARELADYCTSIGNIKVNLIPFNDVAGLKFQASTAESLKTFQDILDKAGIATHVRKARGGDIDGACGQLVVSEPKA